MSVFLFLLGLINHPLPYLQSDIYYDLIIIPEHLLQYEPYPPTSLPLPRHSAKQVDDVDIGFYLPNYQECTESAGGSVCSNLSDFRPELELGSENWKIRANISSKKQIKLKFKFPLQ